MIEFCNKKPTYFLAVLYNQLMNDLLPFIILLNFHFNSFQEYSKTNKRKRQKSLVPRHKWYIIEDYICRSRPFYSWITKEEDLNEKFIRYIKLIRHQKILFENIIYLLSKNVTLLANLFSNVFYITFQVSMQKKWMWSRNFLLCPIGNKRVSGNRIQFTCMPLNF